MTKSPVTHCCLPASSLRISLARTTVPPSVGRGTFAEVVGGPADLLAWLESRLGLPTRFDAVSRLGALCAALERAHAARQLSPNLSKSFVSHPYAVASRLLSHRDAFLMAVPLTRGDASPPLDIDSSIPSALSTSLPTIVRQYNVAITSATKDERAAICVGEPDRLARVLQAVLDGQSPPPSNAVILDDKADWPARWQSLLDLLNSPNTPVCIDWRPAQPAPQAPVASALYTVQSVLVPGFNPAATPQTTPDDTLRVARCASKVVAAQAAASALQGLAVDQLPAAVVICGDDAVAAMIDAHLHASGLPTMGIATASQTSGILATLPLAIEAVGSPADPSQVKLLLSLPESPISRAARAQLLKALDDLPAVGSPSWTRAVRTIRTKWKRGLRQAAVIEEWIPVPQRWCRSQVGFDAVALQAAVTRVSRWANQRNRRLKESIRQTLAAGVHTASAGSQLDLTVTRSLHFQALFARCRAMLSLIKQSNISGLVDRATIMQLIDTVHAGQVTLAIHPNSAGGPRRVRSLAEIGDFLGPVSQAIWVGPFRQPSPRAPWSSGDIARAKSAHALSLDFTAGRLEAETRAEEAGLCHLSGSLLVLAHPSGDGAARPHPLWLMITEILRNALPTPQPFTYEPDLLDSSQAPMQLAPWIIARAVQPLEPEPAWVTAISLDPSTAMPLRRTVSHSDVERRLTCPVAWAFEYGAHLAPPAGAALPSAEISRGTVGEQVLREVFATSPPRNLPDAFAKLDRILRRRLPRLHAELCSPLAREQREEFELSLRKAVQVLHALIDSGIRITFDATLAHFTDPSGNSIAWQGLSPRGAIDALGTVTLHHAQVPIVIDMKFGGAEGHGNRLKQGNCTQLVLYSNFVQLRNPTTPVDSIGYLVISEGCLLVPAWAAGFLASPSLARWVKVVGDPTSYTLPQLITDVDQRVTAAASSMHQTGALLQAHPRFAAAGTTPHPDLAFIHGSDPAKAAEQACKYCKYSLLCGKDRVR